jgi:hypothetical protein
LITDLEEITVQFGANLWRTAGKQAAKTASNLFIPAICWVNFLLDRCETLEQSPAKAGLFALNY